VLEGLGVEVGAQLAVDDMEHVAVELGGDALRVVVGGFDDRRVLDEVGAEQEGVAGAQHAAHVAEQAPAASGWEVADRASQQGDQATATVGWRHLAQVALEVADDAVYLEPGVVVDQLVGGLAHHALGDVDRHVALRALHRVEQHPRLQRGAGAQLHQLAGRVGRRDDLGRASTQDRRLGAGGVVLGELADELEQLGAAGVVEVLGRDLLERLGQAVEHVVGQTALGALPDVHVDHRIHASLAIRSPEKIWRRCGKSQLRKVGVATRARVAHEPPRSTR
jgi:hypothetical protein